jgi:Flp pilus assembly pilin Flp
MDNVTDWDRYGFDEWVEKNLPKEGIEFDGSMLGLDAILAVPIGGDADMEMPERTFNRVVKYLHDEGRDVDLKTRQYGHVIGELRPIFNVREGVSAITGESGQTMAEYGVVLAVIVIGVVVAIAALGVGITGAIDSVVSKL